MDIYNSCDRHAIFHVHLWFFYLYKSGKFKNLFQFIFGPLDHAVIVYGRA